jgi:hypothetical protein
MKISLEQNVKNDNGAVPYFVNIEISTMTIDLDTTFHIPVYQYTNGKTIYNTEVCGFRVEADAPDQIVPVTERLIRGLVNMARLPTYVFIARRSRQIYPVYTVGDEVFATTPGGPVFRHVELAKVREYLAEYLNEMGIIGTPGMSEKLRARGVNMDSLALIRPIFYLKKRPKVEDEDEFWAPVFLADDQASIYTYAASGKREIDLSGGYETLLLRSQVAQALIADKRLKDNYDLRPDRLLPDYWERVKSTLKLQLGKLVFDGTAFDIYRNGRAVIAVEHRADEDRYSLYIGKDLDDLRERTAKDLVRRGLISNTEAVKFHK